MTDASRVFDGRVHVHYGFLHLTPPEELPGDLMAQRSGQANGICGAQIQHELGMVTGLHTGAIPLVIEWHPSEPPLSEDWEDIVEASVDLAGREQQLSAFDEFHSLVFPQDGWHRARYSVNGMDAGRDLDTALEEDEVPDRYLLQLWQAEHRVDRIVRQTSKCAGYWHSVAEG